MNIRYMTEDDLDIVADLERQIFSDPWSKTSFEFEIHRNRYSIPLVLESENQIIGYAVVWKIYEEFHIANLAIRPEFQGKKIGTYFLEEILKYSGGCKYALLEVRESNIRAQNLYKKFGFRTILKRRHYYKNGENALVMQKIFGKD
ncbi:MAG: ribosomal protein S18-alanine N-acetyltransferase [Calditrichia bacterium]